MDDLVERLRYTHEHGIFDANVAGMLASPNEAADALEALQADLEAIKHSRDDWCSTATALTADLAAAEARGYLRGLEEAAGDTARLDWLQSEFQDVRWLNDSDDGVILQIVSHWQAKPCERIEAENYHENLRAAIDDARLKDKQP